MRALSYQHAHRRVDLPCPLWTKGRKRGASPVDCFCCNTVKQPAVSDDLEGQPELRYNVGGVMWSSPAECKVCARHTREALLTGPPSCESGFRYQLTTKEVLALAGVRAAGPDHPTPSAQVSRNIDYHVGQSFMGRMRSNSEMISFESQAQPSRIMLRMCL